MEKYICDTNFVIRYLIADNDEMFLHTKKMFNKVRDGEVNVILLETVFTEIIYVLSSFYKVPRDKITDILSSLISYKGIITNKKILLDTLQLYKNTNLHIVDCLLAIMAQNQNLQLLSFDQELNKRKK